jgi:hypothetical protein
MGVGGLDVGVLGPAGFFDRLAEAVPADRRQKSPQFCAMSTSVRFMFMAVTTNWRWQAFQANP